MIAQDQYGQIHRIKGKHPRKELLNLFGVTGAQKMYVDDVHGNTKHIGYIINGLWLHLFKLDEVVLSKEKI